MTMSNRINKIGTIISYLYIGIPFIIFLLGWCKWYVSCIGIAAVVYALYKVCNNDLNISGIIWTKKNANQVIGVLLILAMWVYLSGIGGYAFQNSDHTVRNTIFETLVHNPWPVVREYSVDEQVITRGLIYYIGFWLPAAAVGKILGIQIGYFALYLWALLGVCIIFFWICQIRSSVEIWPVFVLIFFSGLDILGYYLTHGSFKDVTSQMHMEWWMDTYQFSSNTTQLFWVFNQAIPAWIITTLLYVQKNNRQIVFLLALAMLSCTFPFVGMIPFVIYFMIRNTQKNVKIKERLLDFAKNIFTVENIVAGGLVGFISFFYLMSNISAGTMNISSNTNTVVEQEAIVEQETMVVEEMNNQTGISNEEATSYDVVDMDMLNRQAKIGVSIFKGVLFLLIECGFYIVMLYYWGNRERQGLLYVILVSFIACLLIKVGAGADFCMRASIPGLFILCIEIIRAIDNCKSNRIYTGLVVLIITIAVGAVTPMHELNRTIQTSLIKLNNEIPIIDDFIKEENLLQKGNFSGITENSIFFKYLASKN